MRNTTINYQDSVKDYNQRIRKVASYFENVTLIDIEKVFKRLSKKELQNHLLKDGVHLSKLGHKLYYKSVRGIVIDTINQDI